MPALRQRLTRPGTWLVLIAVAVGLVVLDTYEPTCSEFSLEAVRTHGLRKGLALTARRIHSCKVEVPLGTYDPVPPPAE